jgi:ATP-dependent exoDNAse (exonuclease V) beta subunit
MNIILIIKKINLLKKRTKLGNFKIYRSSAGSGKTFTLVKEYIKLCFRYPANFKNILAVTFTNMATDEMKKKIISELDALAENEDTNLRKILIKEGIEEKVIALRAKEVLSQILHNYSAFSVTTIDSFFHRVLRSFAKELKLSPGYNVELDEDLVLEELVDKMWHQTESDEDLRNFIIRFIHYNMELQEGWRIEKNLFKLGKEIFKDRYWERKLLSGKDFRDDRSTINELIKTLRAIRETFKLDMREIGEAALQFIARYNLTVEDFKNKKTSPANYFRKIFLQSADDWFLPGVRALKSCDDRKEWYTKDSPKAGIIQECLDDGLLNFMNLAVSYYNKKSPKYFSSIRILDNIFIFGIFNDLTALMKTYESENNIVLQSNISRILRLIISEENSPFIFDKIGSNFKHFLIDEFQDTSTFQWKNFIPLIINSLSEKRFSMVVGDAKQSIYRWRNGNMRLILKDIYEDLPGFESEIDTENLGTNFRSAKKIVDFNNSFFKSISEDLDLKTETGKDIASKGFGGNDLIQEKFIESDGYVNLILLDSDSKTKKEDSMSLANIRVKQIIDEVKNAGYGLNDITILVRNKKEGILISDFLIKSEVSVISSESLMLVNSPKIKLIINSIEFIADRKNDINTAELLFNYKKYIQNDEFDNHELFSIIKQHPGENLNDFLPDNFINKNGYLNSALYNLNVYELTEYLISIFKFDKSPDLYLIKMLEVLREYVSSNSSDIKSFLEWWRKKSDSFAITTPENADAVRILTIHKMKGLQNKVIIIPYASWETVPISTRDYMWVSSEEKPYNMIPAFPVTTSSKLTDTFFSQDYLTEIDLTLIDNINLLYVAFTRAEEALYIISYDWKTENTGRIIKNRIENTPELKAVLSGNELKSGKLLSKKPVKNSEKGEYKFISSPWQKKAVIRPSNYGIKPWEKRFDSVSEGILIHEIMSRITYESDFGDIIENYINYGLINTSKAEKLRQKFSELMSDKKIGKWFSADYQVLNEAEIIDGSGSVIRPDRIMIKGNDLVCLDYKTGKENKYHTQQIEKYMSALKEMKYESVEGYILYLNQPFKLIQV